MVCDAVKLRRSGELLAPEAARMFERAGQQPGAALDAPYSLARALRAAGARDWTGARREELEAGMLCKAWKARLRIAVHGFFANETLTGRALTVAGTSGASIGDRNVAIGEQAGSNNFLQLCTTLRPTLGDGDQVVAGFDALPTVSELADESASIADATPDTVGGALAPINLGTYVQMHKRWLVQGVGGAEALQRVILAALRTKAQAQIIEGADSGGEALGLSANSDVPHGSGASIDWSGICDALAAIKDGAGDAPLTWIVTARAATILRQRERASGSNMIMQDGKIGGYPAIVVGGAAGSHPILGKWTHLTICEWTPLELSVNPFAVFAASVIGVKGWLSFNFAPSVLSSFFAIPDIT